MTDHPNPEESIRFLLAEVKERDAEIVKLNHLLAKRVEMEAAATVEGERVRTAAQDLYDNRLGWSDGRNPYAPPVFWERLGQELEKR